MRYYCFRRSEFVFDNIQLLRPELITLRTNLIDIFSESELVFNNQRMGCQNILVASSLKHYSHVTYQFI